MEQNEAFSARDAQKQLLEHLSECDPGYAAGIIVEMKPNDLFPPSSAPEDRKGYFVLDESGKLRMVDGSLVYNLPGIAYTVGRQQA